MQRVAVLPDHDPRAKPDPAAHPAPLDGFVNIITGLRCACPVPNSILCRTVLLGLPKTPAERGTLSANQWSAWSAVSMVLGLSPYYNLRF